MWALIALVASVLMPSRPAKHVLNSIAAAAIAPNTTQPTRAWHRNLSRALAKLRGLESAFMGARPPCVSGHSSHMEWMARLACTGGSLHRWQRAGRRTTSTGAQHPYACLQRCQQQSAPSLAMRLSKPGGGRASMVSQGSLAKGWVWALLGMGWHATIYRPASITHPPPCGTHSGCSEGPGRGASIMATLSCNEQGTCICT